jgi:hypothetical protein
MSKARRACEGLVRDAKAKCTPEEVRGGKEQEVKLESLFPVMP